jgi:formylglycine-generating enzyme required for sulfatase activity
MVRDLQPLDYQPSDPRYRATVDSVLGIFEADKAESIPLEVRLEAAEALGQAGDLRLAQDNWITIPAGGFLMGAQKKGPAALNYDPAADDDEDPAHVVFLDAYQIGRYPVTVQEFARFVEDQGYTEELWWAAGGFGKERQPEEWDVQVLHPNRPVVGVSWYEAAAYCTWASLRLPTEAQWERAARGTTGTMYPWGNEAPNATHANYDGQVRRATPVGLYPSGATPEGVEDLAGNVWEWVADWYGEDYYRESPTKNPPGPASGYLRVVRGGSWDVPARTLRAANRYGEGPALRYHVVGFRCVREVASP